jgi:hypothetical protein
LSRHTASFAGPPAVQITRAPRATASWVAAMPTPPAPACTSTVWPAPTPARSRAQNAVWYVTGSAAATTGSKPAGSGVASAASSVTVSPSAPCGSAGQATTSTSDRCSVPAPVATTRPANSTPGVIGGSGRTG